MQEMQELCFHLARISALTSEGENPRRKRLPAGTGVKRYSLAFPRGLATPLRFPLARPIPASALISSASRLRLDDSPPCAKRLAGPISSVSRKTTSRLPIRMRRGDGRGGGRGRETFSAGPFSGRTWILIPANTLDRPGAKRDDPIWSPGEWVVAVNVDGRKRCPSGIYRETLLVYRRPLSPQSLGNTISRTGGENNSESRCAARGSREEILHFHVLSQSRSRNFDSTFLFRSSL